ncbi:hypothetical protein DVA43_06085 [Leclercia sp. W6]|nr:hypothetical protein DVA43_06085 [Leclercia sp. W6]
MPGGAALARAYTSTGHVGRVRRSRHPALQVLHCSQYLLIGLIRDPHAVQQVGKILHRHKGHCALAGDDVGDDPHRLPGQAVYYRPAGHARHRPRPGDDAVVAAVALNEAVDLAPAGFGQAVDGAVAKQGDVASSPGPGQLMHDLAAVVIGNDRHIADRMLGPDRLQQRYRDVRGGEGQLA